MFRNSNSLGRFREVSLEQAGLTVRAALDQAASLTPEQGVRIAMEHAEIFSDVTMSLEAMSLQLESFDREASTLSLDMQAFYGAWDAISRASIPDKSQVAQMVGKGMPRFRKKYRLSFESEMEDAARAQFNRVHEANTTPPKSIEQHYIERLEKNLSKINKQEDDTTSSRPSPSPSLPPAPPPDQPQRAASSDVQDDPYDISKVLDDSGQPYMASGDAVSTATNDVTPKEDSVVAEEAKAKEKAEKSFLKAMWERFVALLKSIWEAIKKFFSANDPEKRLEKTKVKIVKSEEAYEKILETVPPKVLKENDLDIPGFKLFTNLDKSVTGVPAAKNAQKVFESTCDVILQTAKYYERYLHDLNTALKGERGKTFDAFFKSTREFITAMTNLDNRTDRSVSENIRRVVEYVRNVEPDDNATVLDMAFDGSYVIFYQWQSFTDVNFKVAQINNSKENLHVTTLKPSEVPGVLEILGKIAQTCCDTRKKYEEKLDEIERFGKSIIRNATTMTMDDDTKREVGKYIVQGIPAMTTVLGTIGAYLAKAGDSVSSASNQLKNALEAYQQEHKV